MWSKVHGTHSNRNSSRYDKIHIVGHDSQIQLKRYKMKTGVRLKLLRRTLRERRALAQYVHELKVPNIQSDPAMFDAETINLVASVIMACPNFERLVGFSPTYHHEFDRLTYALSTRRGLKEYMWIIGENNAITQRSQKQLPPGLMDIDQVDSFLHYNSGWASLTTLILHSENQGVLEHDIFIEMFHRLPALRHLCVSSFDVDDFNDMTLEHVPPLQSLRLESLAGITDQGLSRFASARAAQGIERLSLVRLSLTSYFVLSKLLAHLNYLTRFTYIQDSSPSVPSDAIVFQPIIASTTLSFLHWDVMSPVSIATDHLAASIRANGFPSLRTIRAPSDPKGVLQATCKPRAQIVLGGDRYNTSQRYNPSPHSLYAARQAAQARIDEARKTVQFQVIVDEEGEVKQIYDFNGFIGTIGSKVAYSLKPDVVGSESGVALISDLRKGEGEGKEGCTGLWNASHHAGKKWWWHRERSRWRGTDLDKLF